MKIIGKRSKERLVPINHGLSQLAEKYLQKRAELELETTALFVTAKGKAAYPKLIYTLVNKHLGESFYIK